MTRDQIEHARALLLQWTCEPWSDLAAWLRDEPDLEGADRVLLLGAAMHAGLKYASRDARRVIVDEERDGELLLRAPDAMLVRGDTHAMLFAMGMYCG